MNHPFPAHRFLSRRGLVLVGWLLAVTGSLAASPTFTQLNTKRSWESPNFYVGDTYQYEIGNAAPFQPVTDTLSREGVVLGANRPEGSTDAAGHWMVQGSLDGAPTGNTVGCFHFR